MLAFQVRSQLMRPDLHGRHQCRFVFGPLSKPEVLIRCRDPLACVQTVVLIKNPTLQTVSVNLVKAVHSTRAKLIFWQNNPTLLVHADFITFSCGHEKSLPNEGVTSWKPICKQQGGSYKLQLCFYSLNHFSPTKLPFALNHDATLYPFMFPHLLLSPIKVEEEPKAFELTPGQSVGTGSSVSHKDPTYFPATVNL